MRRARAEMAAEAEEAWEAEAEEEEEEAPRLGACVEPAKSGRSLCRECRLPIKDASLRIGGASTQRPCCLRARTR